MTINVIIMQGVSGSGKSTYARNVQRSRNASAETCWIVSADDYFVDSEGRYNFDPSKLGEAHATCFARVLDLLRMAGDVDPARSMCIIVDNTNSTAIEIAPYMAAAAASKLDTGHEVFTTIVRVRCPIDLALSRTTHGTPLRSIRQQTANIEDFDKPGGNPFGWKVVPADATHLGPREQKTA